MVRLNINGYSYSIENTVGICSGTIVLSGYCGSWVADAVDGPMGQVIHLERVDT